MYQVLVLVVANPLTAKILCNGSVMHQRIDEKESILHTVGTVLLASSDSSVEELII